MADLIKRFGNNLKDQQRALCEEWKKALCNPAPLMLEPWEKEVRDFTGADSLSGDAWARLQNWYKSRTS